MTRNQVLDVIRPFLHKLTAEEQKGFEDTGLIRSCRLPDGAWFSHQSRYADGVWMCQVLAGVYGPEDGVRIQPWTRENGVARKLPSQEFNPFEYVSVVDPPDWVEDSVQA